MSVWCRTYNANFGYVNISSKFEAPSELVLQPLPSRAHRVKSGKIILNDSKTITIYELYYDGAAPDAFFLVGKGKPNPSGYKVPDENGRTGKIKGYSGKDITLRLPGNLTWFDLDWFALYCIQYRENFGEVYIPKNLNIPIDLTGILKNENLVLKNCYEIFPNRLIVRWKVVENDIYLQIEGRANDDKYLSFGISGQENRAVMEGADVAVVFYDKSKSAVDVVDYYLSSKAQCSLNDGACPDVRIQGLQNINLLNWKYENNILIATYQRHLKSAEKQDKSIELNKPTTVVAAIGPLNSKNEVAKHSLVTRDLIQINFGENRQQCTSLKSEEETEPNLKPWTQHKISKQTLFIAQIGPTGRKRGYTAITGLPGWGLAWWINGYLIPELTVERGVTYTFIVEGGSNSSNTASYHPFYITNNKEGGGYQYQSELWTSKHMIYAGMIKDSRDNSIILTGVGRLCEYTINPMFKNFDIDKLANDTETFKEFKSFLKLVCQNGSAGAFTWTPNEDTPDTVYYQCYIHRNFGWKINVINSDKHPGSRKGNGTGNLFIFWNWVLILLFYIIISLFI